MERVLRHPFFMGMFKLNSQLILNFTPNSFSDGGIHNDKDIVFETLSWCQQFGIKHFDLGAESTAPMNQSISANEELERFEIFFFPLLERKDIKVMLDREDITLSVDTYRASTFNAVYARIKKRLDRPEVIWNDVSGVVDHDVLEQLKKGRYILCHNLAGERALSGKHQNFLVPSDQNIYQSVKSFFEEKLKLVPKELHHKIILDPCFGFSKDRAQNMELLEQMEKLILDFPEHDWLIGISRKSFIRHFVMENNQVTELDKTQINHLCDQWQLQYFSKLLPSLRVKMKRQIFIRLHDSLVAKELNHRYGV
jgi:dihydropteroate synthase